MTDSTPLTGGCICGSVRYSVAAEPVFVGYCACGNCRKVTGCEHSTFFAVPDAAAEVTGETRSYAYPGDSGKNVARHFCPKCGGHAYSKPEAMPQLRMFSVGTLDDITRVQPGAFVYHALKAPWDNAGAGIATFDALPPPA